jgi:hypothetical protein
VAPPVVSHFDNHARVVALYALWYNFHRIQKYAANLARDGGRDRKPAMVV